MSKRASSLAGIVSLIDERVKLIKVSVGEPLPTCYGEDLYQKVFQIQL